MQRRRLLPSNWSSRMYLFPSRVIPFSSQPVGSVLGVSTLPVLGKGGGGKLFCNRQPAEDMELVSWSTDEEDRLNLSRSVWVVETTLLGFSSKDIGDGDAAGEEAPDDGLGAGEDTGVMITL